jgi:hypothetical protein
MSARASFLIPDTAHAQLSVLISKTLTRRFTNVFFTTELHTYSQVLPGHHFYFKKDAQTINGLNGMAGTLST